MSEPCLEKGSVVLLYPLCNKLFRPDSPSNPYGVKGQIIEELNDSEDEYDFLVQWPNGVQNEYNYCELIPYESPVIKCVVEIGGQKIEFDSIEKAKDYINTYNEVPLKYFVAESTQKSFTYMGCTFKVGCDSNYRYVAADQNGYIYVYNDEPFWIEGTGSWSSEGDSCSCGYEEIGRVKNSSYFNYEHAHKSLQEIKYHD
ncbi:hypothetical protein [Providencia phage PSTCR6]|nr:hypothetical protein [Providencia phage PSTCR6]